MIYEGRLAEIGADEAISIVNRMAVVTAHLMEKPEVWQTVLALAHKLPAVGRMDGAKAAAIITDIIPETDLTGMFGEALERMRKLEQTIKLNEVVVAIFPDGSQCIIRGARVLEKHATDGQGTLQVLQYECALPIFAEVLWRAFGDGSASREGAKAA